MTPFTTLLRRLGRSGDAVPRKTYDGAVEIPNRPGHGLAHITPVTESVHLVTLADTPTLSATDRNHLRPECDGRDRLPAHPRISPKTP